MAEEIQKLVQQYREGKINRREFIRQAVVLTGSLAAANALIDSFFSPSAEAAQVAPDDPALSSRDVQYPGKQGQISGYLAKPSAAGKYAAVIVIHENRGLDDHIRDVARRFAKEGFVALAPDYLSRHGGTAKVNPSGGGISAIREMVPLSAVAEDTEASMAYLRGLPEVRGDRIGLVGFCWGGEMTFGVATQVRGLRAAVVYYGRSPNPVDLVKNIEAPVLAHYGEKDEGVNKTIAPAEEAMKKYNKRYTYKIYPGAQHAFNNDTNPGRYHPEAAKEAWARTIEFFKKELG
ncbi:MAG TPA: dienelactone hydrolase family protein [Candidatus Acidoferrales bacterium]|nr:dienelactone hydrolase family protein [Candidatus Acidoferrales bacterium]